MNNNNYLFILFNSFFIILFDKFFLCQFKNSNFFVISLYFKKFNKNTKLVFKRFLTLLICFVLTPSFLTSNSAVFIIVSFMFYYEKIFRNKFLDLCLKSLLFTFYFIPLQIFYFYSFSVVIQSLLIILRPLFSFLYFSIFI